MTEPLELWRSTFRVGFLPQWDDDTLEALAAALRADDPRLGQGFTTQPPPLMITQTRSCTGADPIAFAGVLANGGWGVATVGQVEEFFAGACFKADERLGEPAACRWWLNWWDDMPRAGAFYQARLEVEREQMKRAIVPLPEELAGAVWAQPADPVLRLAVADYWHGEGKPERAAYWERSAQLLGVTT